MCLYCDGYSDGEVRRDLELRIAAYGWGVEGVEAPVDGPGEPWAYTVGLVEGFGVPELLVVGLGFREACHLLNRCGSVLAKGGTPDDLWDEFALRAEVVADHLLTGTDLVNSWTWFYGSPPMQGQFLQLVPEFGIDELQAELEDDLDQDPDSPELRAAMAQIDEMFKARAPE